MQTSKCACGNELFYATYLVVADYAVNVLTSSEVDLIDVANEDRPEIESVTCVRCKRVYHVNEDLT